MVVAVAGTDGETLWERPLAPEFHWAQCGLGGEEEPAGWDCLLFHADRLTALDKSSGEPPPHVFIAVICSVQFPSCYSFYPKGISERALV